eukprot:c29611_g1_i1 orf=20-289(-)
MLRPSDLMAGTNDLEEEEIIGEGRTRTVYKAVLAERSMLALKRLCVSAHSDKDFKAEMDMLVCVRHKNLVLLFYSCSGFGEAAGVQPHS